ncbi:hypothetical protein AA309_12950 [Microvirga vignae]|uniref:Uncharacterized protein n=1 Tax=Microvirga vignae TaxID=1225564 RepID=A0A0H1RC28_9HYPH|nr:hypothetical protein [Microvirga vignae]KLK92609.1 hypothetical protein AA309_12950 [Microvirga vignae]
MTYSRDTTAISELTGQPVNTWFEEWRIETEARAILKMSKVRRDGFFNGRKDENGKTVDRGVFGIRGLMAAEEIKATMQGCRRHGAAGSARRLLKRRAAPELNWLWSAALPL